ncbi:MAG TPA: hypothetical protein VKL99_02165, partial [Candidatus Angelobacter sp.]|nr:hypothetical protein [Candidatus Angelobacter sp.]
MRTGFFRWLSLIAVVAFLAGQAVGQKPEQPIDAETVKALLQRVQDLEIEVKALKVQVHDSASTPPAIPETALTANTNQPAAEQEPSLHQMEMAGPRLRLRGYGDVDWNVSDAKGTTNSFALGQLNLFLTSQLSDKVSFLAETVIEADKETNEFSIEPERLMLVYNASDWLNLSIGRYHTGIGYYNTAYHHSALM